MDFIFGILLLVFCGTNNSHYTHSHVSSINTLTPCYFSVGNLAVPWECAEMDQIFIGRSVSLYRKHRWSAWTFDGFYNGKI